jgi:hypothetical protein
MLAKHLRISLEDARTLGNRIKCIIYKRPAWTLAYPIASLFSSMPSARCEFHSFVEAQKSRWRQEALSACKACLWSKPSRVVPTINPEPEPFVKPNTKPQPLPKPRISYTLYFTSSVWHGVVPLLAQYGISPLALDRPSPVRPDIYAAHLFIPENRLKDLLAIMPNDPTLPNAFKPQPDPPPPYPPDFHGGI